MQKLFRLFGMEALFEKYQFSDLQRRAFDVVKKAKNMPSFMSEIDDEEIVWAVAIATFDMPSEPDEKDLKFYDEAVESKIRKLQEAEIRYGWFSAKWTKKYMRNLIVNWHCGLMVIDPDLKTNDGSPMQFVHEFYGPESGYPNPEDQTEEWKQDTTNLYALMVRSICKSYPMATAKGIVSFADMKDFDWTKYDWETKTRNADICSLIPNKLRRMISIQADEKMKSFYDSMGLRVRQKYGFVLYENYETAKTEEGAFLPANLPTFVGGTYKVDILKCLKHLFICEPDVLELLMATYGEMEAAGEIPRPEHMK